MSMIKSNKPTVESLAIRAGVLTIDGHHTYWAEGDHTEALDKFAELCAKHYQTDDWADDGYNNVTRRYKVVFAFTDYEVEVDAQGYSTAVALAREKFNDDATAHFTVDRIFVDDVYPILEGD